MNHIWEQTYKYISSDSLETDTSTFDVVSMDITCDDDIEMPKSTSEVHSTKRKRLRQPDVQCMDSRKARTGLLVCKPKCLMSIIISLLSRQIFSARTSLVICAKTDPRRLHRYIRYH